MTMADKKKLLEIKATLKRRQPKFVRQEAYKDRLEKKWRTPRGLHSKQKANIKGHPALLAKGYQTPRAVRGMTKQGLMPVRVVRVDELAALDPSRHCVVLGKVGARRAIEIIEAAGEKRLTLQNASPQKASALKDRFTARKTKGEQRQKAREEKHKKLEERLDAEEKKGKAEGKDAHEGHNHEHEHKAEKKHAPKPAAAPAKTRQPEDGTTSN